MDNKEGIEMVFNEFSSGLKQFILSKVKNEADASDILQDTFLKIHDNISGLKNKNLIKPWIYQVARNLVIDYFRAQNRNRKATGSLEIPISVPSEKFMDVAIADMINMMDELSPEYCEALCLTEIEGMSQKEYAEKMGLSYSGAKSRVQRARIMLKDMLLNCCHYQFDKYGTVFNIEPKCCCCCAPEIKI
jgi:RNA polymerase sigma-70 factor (ECF subfamily)